MSNHTEGALDMLGRVPGLDDGSGEPTTHYQLAYCLTGAVVYALLDVASAIRGEPAERTPLVDDQLGPDGRPL